MRRANVDAAISNDVGEYEQEHFTKPLVKLLNRIERIMVPSITLVHSYLGARICGLQNGIRTGRYYESIGKSKSQRRIKRINWKLLVADIKLALADGDTAFELPPAIIEEIEAEKDFQDKEEAKHKIEATIKSMQERNDLPVVSGSWRKRPFPIRQYVPISEYVVTQNISPQEGNLLKDELISPLEGFLGQAYNYDDHVLTEEWMCSFKDGRSSAPSDDDVIRTQLESLMEILTYTVQDRVCNSNGVLRRDPVGLGSRLKECPVWGIDCYTRRMIELSIEDRVPGASKDKNSIIRFIEQNVLPTINAQPVDRAHNLLFTMEQLIETNEPGSLPYNFASAVAEAIRELGQELFRIHPKGTGVICVDPHGIDPHVMVSEYLGEIYPPYRWCERMDVVDAAQKCYDLKPTLPDFYNILLERPRQDPRGYGLIFVDASQKANMGSSCSHSCDSNCTSSVVSRKGKLAIVLTTNRHVNFGEELTMDYYSITTSDIEWRAAICLCGMSACRGTFLHYATQDDLQQVLNQNCGPLWRYASLLRACTGKVVPVGDAQTLRQHGMLSVALGEAPPVWMQKYAADNLRFVEFERKALPCALMRPKHKEPNQYTYSGADMDARSVMEQRLQSMVCCFSMIRRVFECQGIDAAQLPTPLRQLTAGEAASYIAEMLSRIGDLLSTHLLCKSKGVNDGLSTDRNKNPNGADKLHASDSSSENIPDDQLQSLVTKAMSEISGILHQDEDHPRGVNWIKQACLEVREILKPLEGYSSITCRCTNRHSFV